MGHTIAGLGDLPDAQDKRIQSLLAGIFVFVVPMFCTGDPPQRPMPVPGGARAGAERNA